MALSYREHMWGWHPSSIDFCLHDFDENKSPNKWYQYHYLAKILGGPPLCPYAWKCFECQLYCRLSKTCLKYTIWEASCFALMLKCRPRGHHQLWQWKVAVINQDASCINQYVGMLQFLYHVLLTHLNRAPMLPFTFEENPMKNTFFIHSHIFLKMVSFVGEWTWIETV